MAAEGTVCSHRRAHIWEALAAVLGGYSLLPVGLCVCFSPTHGILVDICRWKHIKLRRNRTKTFEALFSCAFSNLPSQMAQTHPLGVTPLSPLRLSHNEAVRLSFCLGDSNSFLGLDILFPAPHLNTTVPRALPMSSQLC